ncbi:MAG: ATP-binding cassette domain-containing protein [Desulfovibrio sp.]|nr:MAG: ATP-binding cassette domain-containing protein [Desulfovibrio sp.]
MNPIQAWDITLTKLTAGYSGLVVLRDVNGCFPAGKISVILGGSGCGKSTLLRHILGLNKPVSGSISLGDQDIASLSGRKLRRFRRQLGVLFQDGALLGSLTLAENIGLPLKEHTSLSKREIKDIVLTKLGLVGLAEFAEYYPSQLSGGMRKRAGLARAIVADPPILLCDEPTSGLDPINAAHMDNLLKDMNTRLGVTVVVVSHDLDSLYAVADHVMVLAEGTAAFNGGLEELKATNDPYLRRFLDRNPSEEDLAASIPESTPAPIPTPRKPGSPMERA